MKYDEYSCFFFINKGKIQVKLLGKKKVPSRNKNYKNTQIAQCTINTLCEKMHTRQKQNKNAYEVHKNDTKYQTSLYKYYTRRYTTLDALNDKNINPCENSFYQIKPSIDILEAQTDKIEILNKINRQDDAIKKQLKKQQMILSKSVLYESNNDIKLLSSSLQHEEIFYNSTSKLQCYDTDNTSTLHPYMNGIKSSNLTQFLSLQGVSADSQNQLISLPLNKESFYDPPDIVHTVSYNNTIPSIKNLIYDDTTIQLQDIKVYNKKNESNQRFSSTVLERSIILQLYTHLFCQCHNDLYQKINIFFNLLSLLSKQYENIFSSSTNLLQYRIIIANTIFEQGTYSTNTTTNVTTTNTTTLSPSSTPKSTSIIPILSQQLSPQDLQFQMWDTTRANNEKNPTQTPDTTNYRIPCCISVPSPIITSSQFTSTREEIITPIVPSPCDSISYTIINSSILPEKNTPIDQYEAFDQNGSHNSLFKTFLSTIDSNEEHPEINSKYINTNDKRRRVINLHDDTVKYKYNNTITASFDDTDKYRCNSNNKLENLDDTVMYRYNNNIAASFDDTVKYRYNNNTIATNFDDNIKYKCSNSNTIATNFDDNIKYKCSNNKTITSYNTISCLDDTYSSGDSMKIQPNDTNITEIRRRSKLPLQAILGLRHYFKQSLTMPYPNAKKKLEIANKLNLTFRQVHNWFSNTRKRVYVPWLKRLGIVLLPFKALSPDDTKIMRSVIETVSEEEYMGPI